MAGYLFDFLLVNVFFTVITKLKSAPSASSQQLWSQVKTEIHQSTFKHVRTAYHVHYYLLIVQYGMPLADRKRFSLHYVYFQKVPHE